ncbi:MAG: hypothetical protein JW932_05375 [Deltaproteobacteria bacterium]|nr:hypothetical protein [Deltaproteobacteria bacterium]
MERPFDKLMALSQVEGHRNIANIPASPTEHGFFKRRLLFVPVLNSIGRRDGGG